jgi:hypothetical protein
MPTATVYFVGICSHLSHGSSGIRPHRVVLINASRDRLVNGLLVPKHTARVRLDDSDEPIVLNGATLRLNAVSAGVQYDPTFEPNIPRLSNYSHEPLAPLSSAMASWANADLVSAYFDVAGTLFGAHTSSGAAAAKLVVETVDVPLLTITTFAGERQEIPVGERPFFVENVDVGPVVDDHDFLLQYKMLMRVPADADWPHEPFTGGEPIPGPITVGPGCSNSNYP